MTKPHRIQLSRAKGWRMPANTVKVDRSTRWGNPAVIGKIFEGEEVEDALHAVTIFRDGVVYGCESFPSMTDIRQHLAGKNLACWCSLDAVCHADTLLLIANDDANGIRP